MFLLAEELTTRHFCLVWMLPKFICELWWLQSASSRFLLKSSAAQLETLTHTRKCILLSTSSWHSEFNPFFHLPVIPPHTRQWHLKARNTMFYRCNIHLRQCKCQFLFQRLILMTLDEHLRSVWDHSSSFSYSSELALHGNRKSERREASLLLTELFLPSGTGQFPGSWKVWLTKKLNQHLLLAGWAAQCVQIRLAVLQRVKEKQLWIQMALKCHLSRLSISRIIEPLHSQKPDCRYPRNSVVQVSRSHTALHRIGRRWTTVSTSQLCALDSEFYVRHI